MLLALVLMTVALISALTAMQFAIHGREVAVPKLMGLSPFEAERLGAAFGLQVIVERQFYSPDIPEGKVMTQMPPAGTKVRRGWSIRVAQSLGPQRFAIPDVTRGSERVAELNIQRRGLTLGSIAHVSLPDLPQDEVISQSPPPNASGIAAPKISLLTTESASPQAFLMPNFTGQALGGVTLVLQDAGFRLGSVSIAPSATSPITPAADSSIATSPPAPPPEPTPASVIVSQNPAPGAKIVTGSAVNFEVR